MSRASEASPHASSEALTKAFHPYDKLVIGLPSAMESWTRAYGPAKEWVSVPANPLKPGHRREHAANANINSSSGGGGGGARRGEERPAVEERQRFVTPAASAAGRSEAFYCDACQRDFATEEKYKEHMKTHIYCTVPGCHFTCRENRAYRMQEHMDMLHNRPDAPNLADTGAYLDQRKRRFPTQEAVKDKVEELYYKAARGVVLPEERRRWLKQHGIDVRKRGRSDATFIARGELPPPSSRSPSSHSTASSGSDSGRSAPSQRRHSPPAPAPRGADGSTAAAAAPAAASSATAAAAARPRFLQPPSSMTDPTAPHPSAESSAPSSSSPSSPPAAPAQPAAARPPAPAHPPKIIPLGPNGTLTPRQRVQLVRERYATAKEVPQFYVCHRCGQKGSHWVDDCPTKGDATYNRHVVWGEAKMTADGDKKAKAAQREKESAEQANEDSSREGETTGGVAASAGLKEEGAEAADEPTSSGSGTVLGIYEDAGKAVDEEAAPHSGAPADAEGSRAANSSAVPQDDDDDDAPPPPQSAAAPADAPKEVTRVMAPVAAARQAQQNRHDPTRRPPPPPSLYERLTEEERLNEQGVLLQAMRFFVARNFFKDAA